MRDNAGMPVSNKEISLIARDILTWIDYRFPTLAMKANFFSAGKFPSSGLIGLEGMATSSPDGLFSYGDFHVTTSREKAIRYAVRGQFGGCEALGIVRDAYELLREFDGPESLRICSSHRPVFDLFMVDYTPYLLTFVGVDWGQVRTLTGDAVNVNLVSTLETSSFLKDAGFEFKFPHFPALENVKFEEIFPKQ
jgi:hypothetical protein